MVRRQRRRRFYISVLKYCELPVRDSDGSLIERVEDACRVMIVSMGYLQAPDLESSIPFLPEEIVRPTPPVMYQLLNHVCRS